MNLLPIAQANERILVVHVGTRLQRQERQGALHRAGIEVDDVEARGQASRHGRLAGRRGPVDRDLQGAADVLHAAAFSPGRRRGLPGSRG